MALTLHGSVGKDLRSARMLLVVLVCSLSLAATEQPVDDDWIDPYDMLNYDSSTKTMRKPIGETANYPIAHNQKREHIQDSSQTEQTPCNRQVVDLHRQVEELKKKITLISQQPTCNPVFKRFLSRLRKEIQRVGLPSDSVDVFYDAKIRLSSQSMTEIQTLLEGEDNWRTGALDNAISQILVDLRPHDYKTWTWRFEDTFGVELDTLFKMVLCVLVIVAIICTQLWSTVSWFVQFRRLFAVCFFVSIVWNWLYLYKIAFAEHQNNLVKMDSVNEKCTGLKITDWHDNLKEWYRSTWTLQDDPCKKYYEVMMVDPLLLVPPTKAIAVTVTTFITEPLKHIGQGISDFLKALLKDLPVTLQIPVLLIIVLAIVVFMYGSVQAAFQHGITAPFRRPRNDPPAPRLEQPPCQPQGIEDYDHLAGGDAQQQPTQRHRADDGRLDRNQVHQRRPNRFREKPGKVAVKKPLTIRPHYSEDVMDAELHETEQDPLAESDSENHQDTHEELAGASADVAANTAQSKMKPTESDSSQSKTLEVNEKPSQDESSRDSAASRSEPAGERPSRTDVQDLPTSAEDKKTSFYSLTQVETVGVPVQESSSVSAE